MCTFGSVTIQVKHAVANEDFVVRTLEARKVFISQMTIDSIFSLAFINFSSVNNSMQ